MPCIDKFNGIKICIHSHEHPPPHVHVMYNEFEILVDITNMKTIAGGLPVNQMRQVVDRLKDNAESLIKNFYELNPELK